MTYFIFLTLGFALVVGGGFDGLFRSDFIHYTGWAVVAATVLVGAINQLIHDKDKAERQRRLDL